MNGKPEGVRVRAMLRLEEEVPEDVLSSLQRTSTNQAHILHCFPPPHANIFVIGTAVINTHIAILNKLVRVLVRERRKGERQGGRPGPRENKRLGKVPPCSVLEERSTQTCKHRTRLEQATWIERSCRCPCSPTKLRRLRGR